MFIFVIGIKIFDLIRSLLIYLSSVLYFSIVLNIFQTVKLNQFCDLKNIKCIRKRDILDIWPFLRNVGTPLSSQSLSSKRKPTGSWTSWKEVACRGSLKNDNTRIVLQRHKNIGKFVTPPIYLSVLYRNLGKESIARTSLYTRENVLNLRFRFKMTGCWQFSSEHLFHMVIDWLLQ